MKPLTLCIALLPGLTACLFDQVARTPLPPPPTPMPTPVHNLPTPQCRVRADLLKLCTASSANLRSIWTSPYEHLLTRGVVFSPLARNLDGTWLQVQIPKAVVPPEGPVDAVFVSMPYLFLGQGANLAILDPTLNPAQPEVIGTAALPPETKITAIAMLWHYDHYAYVMADGLRVFDISNPTQPVQVGFYQPPQRDWTGYNTTMASPIAQAAARSAPCYSLRRTYSGTGTDRGTGR